MKPQKPYCPTCHRRLHALHAPPQKPCLECGKPVAGLGLGRPRALHPECRNARAAMRARLLRQRRKEAQP